jgi:hypothetical protein
MIGGSAALPGVLKQWKTTWCIKRYLLKVASSKLSGTI